MHACMHACIQACTCLAFSQRMGMHACGQACSSSVGLSGHTCRCAPHPGSPIGTHTGSMHACSQPTAWAGRQALPQHRPVSTRWVPGSRRRVPGSTRRDKHGSKMPCTRVAPKPHQADTPPRGCPVLRHAGVQACMRVGLEPAERGAPPHGAQTGYGPRLRRPSKRAVWVPSVR